MRLVVPYTIAGLTPPVPPGVGNLTVFVLCAGAKKSLVLTQNLGAPDFILFPGKVQACLFVGEFPILQVILGRENIHSPLCA